LLISNRVSVPMLVALGAAFGVATSFI